MRVTQALSQSLLHRLQPSVPVLGALCLALAVSGCATRTTLGEKPAAAKEDSAAVTPGSGVRQRWTTYRERTDIVCRRGNA